MVSLPADQIWTIGNCTGGGGCVGGGVAGGGGGGPSTSGPDCGAAILDGAPGVGRVGIGTCGAPALADDEDAAPACGDRREKRERKSCAYICIYI